MSRYVGTYIASSAPRIQNATMFEFIDAARGITKIGISQYTVADSLGTQYPAGAYLEVETEAKDLDDAVSLTSAISDLVVVLMNVSTPGWTTFPKPELVYAIDGPVPRPAYLFTPGWTPGPRTGNLDESLFQQVLSQYFNLADEPMWRTSHAANNFRLAMQDPDPAMRVPTTYAGLEFLNPLLDPKYGAAYSGPGQAKGVGGYIEAREGDAFESKARRA